MYFVISFGSLNNLLLNRAGNGSKLLGFQTHETRQEAEEAVQYLEQKSVIEYGGNWEAYAEDPATTEYNVYSLKDAAQYVLQHAESYDDTPALKDFVSEL
jgi:hypothetical protein